MNLLADLEEFVYDHRSHGSLSANATEPAWNGYLLTVSCPVWGGFRAMGDGAGLRAGPFPLRGAELIR
jgi:hypothetical protein